LVVGSTVALGFVLRALANAVDGSWTGSASEGSGWLGDAVAHWVVVPSSLATWLEPLTYIGLIALALALAHLRGWWRLALLVPTLYLAAFVWENLLAPQPEVTRFILLGGLLVGTMIARPEGILGEKRVEVV
jgi:hypothetical protein